LKYYQIDIETTEAGIEAIVAKLMAAGIENTVVADPKDVADLMEKKESYAWDYVEDEVAARMEKPPVVTVYAYEDAELSSTKHALAALRQDAASGLFGEGADFGPLEPVITEHDDSEWQDKWKEYFKPFRVSEHILIKPSWEEVEAGPEDHVLEIDPGMAFGTGTHETTSMCIEMMEGYLQPGSRVLDAGCGSGILSIAAAFLGAGDVLGVDIDEDAVRVARENIQLNHVEEVARASYGDVTEGVDYLADLVAANLMAELLCMVTPGIYRHLTPGGVYISSGILLEKEEMVTQAIEAAGFSVIEIRRKGEWICIAARKPEGVRP
jgi:ribosomal protein L11 methyltransferase